MFNDEVQFPTCIKLSWSYLNILRNCGVHHMISLKRLSNSKVLTSKIVPGLDGKGQIQINNILICFKKIV